MKRSEQPTLPWWEEYLGWKFDKKKVARRTCQAYFLWVLPPLSLLFATLFAKDQQLSNTIDPTPLTDTAPHLPGSSANYAGPAVPGS
ncbi:MAG TPA: hypothetical protein VEI50_14230 [Nitrospiraceae bacterium]|nr:hypothetical protein [Nitrospiraceae bacterium]